MYFPDTLITNSKVDYGREGGEVERLGGRHGTRQQMCSMSLR